MTSIADELTKVPFLAKCPAPDLRSTAALWAQVSLGPAEALWEEGTVADELGVLVEGGLVAQVDGVEVGRPAVGELLGETTAFFAGTVRSATVRAETGARVLTLATTSLRTMRWQRSPVYEVLLDQALLTLVRRVRATDLRIARVAVGDYAAPARTEPSVLVRLWKALRPGGPSGPCPPIAPLLRRLPGLAEADAEIIAILARAFVAEPVQEGQIVFLEGDPGAAAYLVAEGQVDVLRHVRGERAERLAGLRPGDSFGANTLIERGVRTASCLAATPGWLYRMDREAHGRLRGEARLAWRESVLATLASQIRGANAALQRAAQARAPESEASFQTLLQASGYLEGLPASEAELERVSVVITEPPPRRRR